METETQHPIDVIRRNKPPKIERARNAMKNPLLIQRELNNRSLFEFMKFFWSEYSTEPFVPNWHIKVMCDEISLVAENVAAGIDRPYDLIINVPPGTTKTATVSIFYPLWCWTRWFHFRFITTSYSGALALESAEYSRDIMKSQKFKWLYPELDIKGDKDTKSNFRVIKTQYNGKYKSATQLVGGNRFSTSVGGTLTGFHGHINIADDPIDPNRALSEKEIASTNHWMSQTLPMRKVNKRTSTNIIIMQRLHQNDPSGYLMADPKKRIRHICIPGEIRNYKDQVHPPELAKYYIDDLLDPNRMPWSVMNDMKADLGQYGYAGQVGQKPTPPGGGMFHTDSFQVIQRFTEWHLVEQVIRYWDKAATKGAGAYTVGVKMARLKTGKFLVMDVKRGQWSTEIREKIIRSTAEADGTHVHVFVEQEPGSGGKESAQATVKNLVGFICVADRPMGDKIYRADPFSVQVNDGNVWLIKADWNHDFIDEFEFFPFSTNKDQVDASSGAFAKLVSKKTVHVF